MVSCIPQMKMLMHEQYLCIHLQRPLRKSSHRSMLSDTEKEWQSFLVSLGWSQCNKEAPISKVLEQEVAHTCSSST